ETLKDYLELSWEQCEEIGLDSIYVTKTREQIDKDYYKRNSQIKKKKSKDNYKKERKAKGKLSKKEEINQRRKKIIDLLGKGLKRKKICDTLSISIETYKRDLRVLKEQGLI
ncbi:replication protein, partial [Clostridium perfringens]